MGQVSTVQIHSIEDFVSFLIIAGNCDPLWKLVDIQSLKVEIPVSVKGPRRDGRIDRWGADFLKDLQNSLGWAAKEFGNLNLGGRKYALRQTIEMGSDKSTTDYSDVVRAVIGKMSGKQVTISVILGILCTTGYLAYKEFNESRLTEMRIQCEMAMKESAQSHDERMTEQLSKSNITIIREFNAAVQEAKNITGKMGKDPEKPIRRYVKSMQRDDTLKVGESAEFNKGEALKRLGTLPEKTLFYVNGDGAYILRGVELVGSYQAIKIGQGAEGTLALLERLDDEIKKAILDAVDASMETQSAQEMNLQVDVYFSVKGVEHAVVVGVGSPRKGLNYSLEEIPSEVPRRYWKMQGESSE